MARQSTRVRSIRKKEQAIWHIEKSAELYDEAMEPYLEQFPVMSKAFTIVLDVLNQVRELMERSFDGI